MNRILTRLGFTAAAIVAGGGIVAHAQTATTGGVSGVVSDKNGAPINGATVRLSSTQTSRTYITGTDGSFRLGLLNPGAWTVEVTKAGFQKISQNISVLVNQTQPITFKMGTEAATVVEVLGTASSVDSTTAQTGLTTTMETLDSIPKSRDFNGLIALAPGTADSGGRMLGYSISGATGIENSFVVDGLNTTDMRKGYQGASLPTDFIDQVEIQTGGLKPEYSALGGVVNAVSKSGSNTFAGSAWLTFDARGIQAVPKQNSVARQVSPRNRYDLGFTAGGAILKDKFFYFVGGNLQKLEDGSSATSVNKLGLTDSKFTQNTTNVYAKFNYYITPDHQLTFATQIQKEKAGRDAFYTLYSAVNSAIKTENNITNYVLNYDWAISGNQTLSAKVGRADFSNPGVPQGPNTTQYSDQVAFQTWRPVAGLTPGSLYTYGGIGRFTPVDKNTIDQFKLDYSIFLGSHMVKVGYSYNKNSFAQTIINSGAGLWVIGASTPYTTPDDVTLTVYQNNGKVTGEYTGYYAQDTWEALPGFRIIYGGRVDTAKVKNYQGLTVFDFHDFKDQFQPRIALTWDINNDGKSKVSLGYAKMVEAPPMYGVMRNGGSETYYDLAWDNTAGNNFAYNATNGTFTTSGPGAKTDFSSGFTLPPIADGTRLNTRVEYVAGIDQVLPSGWTVGIHAKYRELIKGMEDTVPSYADGRSPDLSVNPTGGGYIQAANSAGGIYRGGYSILWNPGRSASYISPNTGQRITVSDLPFDPIKNTYTSLDVTAEHKTARDVFNFSYTLSRQEGNYEGMGQVSNGQDEANITSTWDYLPFVGYGLMPLDRSHILKMFGSHTFDVGPGQFSMGATWTYQSGTPLTIMDDGSLANGFASGYDRTNFMYLPSGRMMVPGNFTRASLTPVGGPVNPNYNPTTRTWSGSTTGFHQYLDYGDYKRSVPNKFTYGGDGRTPAYNMVNLNFNYSWKATSKVKVVPSVDVFNLFNTRVATLTEMRALTRTGNPNINFGQDLAWLEGRRYRFGVKVQF